MSDVVEWASTQAARELHKAKAAGLAPARHWHTGRAVVLLMEAGKYDAAAELLEGGLHRVGGPGAQFVAGMRSGVTLLDGARSLRSMDEQANVEAWAAADSADTYPSAVREGVHDEAGR